MVIRGRNRLRMVIKQARYKAAYYKVVCFKCLVYWWWLVHTTGNRFKIVDAKCKWIATAIPAYHIKRVMRIVQAIEYPFFLRLNSKITLFIYCLQVLRFAYITLAVRRMLQQLPVFAQ